MKRIYNSTETRHIWVNILVVIIIIAIIIGVYFIGYYGGYNKGKDECKFNYTPPVEKEVIDTLYIRRDSIINKIQYLEVIKHDTIEKVYILDDNATIDLFYKLVSE